MLEWWNGICLTVMDGLLGWLLGLPSDITLLAVAIGSALILTLVRLFTTNQELLGRVAADRKRLGQLIRQAKAARDRDAVRRYRATKATISLIALKAEGLPLLVSLLPIAMLATWCLHRLDFHPPRVGETVTVAAYTPLSMAGEAIHIVPADGLEAPEGWVRAVRAVEDQGPPHGMATWTVRATAPGTFPLRFRVKDAAFACDLSVGRRTYSQPIVDHGNELVTELQMRPVKLLGIVPGIPQIFFPPWLVAYLLIVIPFVFLLKRVLGIH